ncbi:uncharacterized protein JN550_001932 [Neoarthrinium moseri]|uniref:uncharacterized protein n=1 Tax=Neoarthrinium moseri TaxID=1658444 RepID=UPI001FDC1E78|nr:uncharacterized protein JN550_001932 [Neoarthrinium moseri]KAI1875646.1 hypothetical protein JN550_001932 [Neoarthrinium moseri]
MAPLMPLDEAAHLNAVQTVRNAGTAFLRIPLEIRLAIYEDAVALKGPIYAWQVQKHSNKFRWSLSDAGHVRSSHQDRQHCRQKPFTVVSLAQTCRQIYHELENFPVFYRMNNIGFRKCNDLVAFLVSITPKRREMLRNITLSFNWDNGHNTFFTYHSKQEKHICVMLSQCKDLQGLWFQIDIGASYWSPGMSQQQRVMDNLKRCLEDICSSDDYTQVLNFPLGRIRLTSMSDSFNSGPLNSDPNARDFKLDLLETERPDDSDPEAWYHQQAVVGLIKKIKERLTSHRQRFMDTMGMEGLPSLFSDAQLQAAYIAARIDFPGEDRIEQDLQKSTSGAVSGRTRGRSKLKATVNEWGVIKREQHKYDAEGILTYDHFFIRNVRWSGSNIECEVEHDEDIPASWEPIHATLSDSGRWRILNFYQSFTRKLMIEGASKSLEEISDLPTPKNITDVIYGLLDDWHHENLPAWRGWVNAWDRLKLLFDEEILRLQQEAEASKKAAAQAKRVQKRKKSSKKRSLSASGEVQRSTRAAKRRE